MELATFTCAFSLRMYHNTASSWPLLSSAGSFSPQAFECVSSRSYLYGHQPDLWPAFISRMQPHLSHLTSSSLVEFICADSGKKTVVLGIDECWMAESIFPSSFSQELAHLFRINPRVARVIPIITSASLERSYTSWVRDSRYLVTIPLPSIDPKSVFEHAATDFFECFNEREKETINDALVFTGGHHRSMALVLAKVEANRNKRAAEPKAAVPLESSLESLVRLL